MRNYTDLNLILVMPPGEKYQIEKRHDKLIELFEYCLKNNGKIKGD